VATLAPLITVVLGLPKSKAIAPTIVRVTAIADAIAANKARFTSPTPPLTQVTSDLSTLTSAETAFKNRLGTRAARDAALTTVISNARQLRVYVQQVVSSNPSQAETIAQNASMTLRKKGASSKSDLSVKQIVSGSVKVVAKAVKGAKAHDWQYSTDGGKTWIDAGSTTKSSTTITGLVPGTTVSYRNRVLTTAGRSDWSQAVSAVVS
jgi:hypothetical protein